MGSAPTSNLTGTWRFGNGSQFVLDEQGMRTWVSSEQSSILGASKEEI